MLSSQTKDEVTDTAVSNLRKAVGGALSVDAVRNASDSDISNAIAKVGFWRRKTQQVQIVSSSRFPTLTRTKVYQTDRTETVRRVRLGRAPNCRRAVFLARRRPEDGFLVFAGGLEHVRGGSFVYSQMKDANYTPSET